jgi:hypothetical protein
MFIKIIFRSSFVQVEIPNNRKKKSGIKKKEKKIYIERFFFV